MIISCQVLDDFFSRVLHHCAGLDYGVWPPEVISCEAPSTWAVSAGFVAVMLICVPFGYLNLDANKHFQNVSFVCLIVLVGYFLVQFAIIGPLNGQSEELHRTPWATAVQERTIGVVLFSWCFPATLPSWVNEKRPQVSVSKVIWL